MGTDWAKARCPGDVGFGMTCCHISAPPWTLTLTSNAPPRLQRAALVKVTQRVFGPGPPGSEWELFLPHGPGDPARAGGVWFRTDGGLGVLETSGSWRSRFGLGREGRAGYKRPIDGAGSDTLQGEGPHLPCHRTLAQPVVEMGKLRGQVEIWSLLWGGSQKAQGLVRIMTNRSSVSHAL